MAKKNSITIEDKWIDLNTLELKPKTVAKVKEILVVRPIKVALEVVLPKDSSAKDFDYDKNPDVSKFRDNLEKKVSQALADIVAEDQPEEGKSTLDAINSYLEKAVKAFRVVLRTAIAKEIGGECKPDDLMTAGSIHFEKIEYQLGFGDSTETKFDLKDLTKAFKRLKKDQHLGVAWKANEIVVSVRFRKPFKDAELKELRDLLPEGSSRGANMLGGEFHAFAKGKVELRFDESSTPPHEILLRKAFKEQSGQAVHTTVCFIDPKKKDADAKAADSKKGKKSK
jgi:hypothetical protein